MTSSFSWQNSISVCPASFRISRPNLLVTPGVFLTSYFCIPVPYNEKDIFFGVLFLEGLVALHKTIQFQLLQHYWSGHRLGLPWYWMVCLGNEQRSFCPFWDCIQVLHFGLSCHIGHLDSFVNIGHYKVLNGVLCGTHSLWFSCPFPSWLVMSNIFLASIWPVILIGELSSWFSLVTYN